MFPSKKSELSKGSAGAVAPAVKNGSSGKGDENGAKKGAANGVSAKGRKSMPGEAKGRGEAGGEGVPVGKAED